ncbi:AEC family transporter [Tamilnaduibacter salinus]|uniref:AEC family transporter n=1 Tax=Tamilnaduibacter salinus TaxID=1484056 RepID=UPI001B807BE6|nr:AEC family transporter [Tamilnaduibacter salinus]
MPHLTFALSAILPIFLVLVVGWWLRRIGWLDDQFTETGSRLVFNLALPALIFTNLIDLELSHLINLTQVGFALGATVVAFLVLWAGSRFWPGPGADRGVFVQGAFRGNLGIIGIAVCASLYGQQGLALGSVLLATLTLLYNFLSVFALTAGGASRWRDVLLTIARNPLILSIFAGLSVAALDLPIPALFVTSAEYFARMTLPLALLCVGAGLSLDDLRHGSPVAFAAVALKLVVLPVMLMLAALPLELAPVALGTLFAMFAAPTATVSYVMVRSLGGNHRLAASIVALSTLLAPFSLAAGLSLLRGQGMI